MAVDPDNLDIGAHYTPHANRVLGPGIFRPLPYKGRCGGLTHRVYLYASWIVIDCLSWRGDPFIVLADTEVITCFLCLKEAWKNGR